MSLQSLVGNVTSKVGNTVQDVVGQAKAHITNIFGTVKTGFSNIWGGGFAGIDENGLETLKGSIDTYCQGIEDTIKGFNEDANIEQAYKGVVGDAVRAYCEGVKELLAAYVSTMRTEKEDANTAFQNWKAAASQLASDITADADQIRSQANEIRVD